MTEGHHTPKSKMGLFLQTLLLLCLVEHSASFGIVGSEVRANRAPISCLSSSGTTRSRRYSTSNSSSSAVEKDTDEENDDKHIYNLIETLGTLADHYIVSGSMATRRRAYNILQEIERLAPDEELVKKSLRKVKRAGMPTDPPPPIPPTEHIPALDQSPQNGQAQKTVILKPMGAMISPTPDAAGDKRKDEVNERLAWEQKMAKKAEMLTKMEDNAPRSALSARKQYVSPRKNTGATIVHNRGGQGGDGGSKGKTDPFAGLGLTKSLEDAVEKTSKDPRANGAANSGLDSVASFAEDKQSLQDSMSYERSPTSPSSDDQLNKVQEAMFNANAPPPAPPKTISPPRYKSNEREMDVASAKSSELIARAGSGDAFLGSVLGVGGLDDVLAQIQRRVWIPLAAPPSLLSELGIQPVRGLLLYGAPGCGKTLLARKLGSILSPCRPITIVSGPEILDKFVGSSEKNLREIFDNPPDIYPEYKKNYKALQNQALHVIVLDEFDAIARRRGGSGGKGDQGDAGVARDSVVNQLLAKMDGVDGLGVPTLLVGLTNKPSLIDSALMRPGRFEVQIEVPKPRTVEQRVAILKVHTGSMVNNGRVLVKDAPSGTAAWKRLQTNTGEESIPTYDELVDIMAVECDGMSGASLAGVARAAASRALERAVTDFAGHVSSESGFSDVNSEGNSISDCLVTQGDFEKAIEDVFESAKSSDYTETDTVATTDKSEKKKLGLDAVDGSTSPPL